MSLADKLTAKQEQVIRGWVGGLTNTEIGQIMRVSNQSVSSMGFTLIRKLGAATAHEACYLWGKSERQSSGT